jgi:hypothetical protein
LHVHEIVLKGRAMSRVAAEAGDDGTNDVIVRRNELQVSFVAGHLVNAPLVQAVSRGCVAAGRPPDD